MKPVVAVARIEVADIAAAAPLYEELADTSARTFAFGQIELAWIGPFLLLQGPAEELARVRRAATLLTDDVERAGETVTAAGGEILEGPTDAPNGPRMIARHPDGSVFEYIQPVAAPYA